MTSKISIIFSYFYSFDFFLLYICFFNFNGHHFSPRCFTMKITFWLLLFLPLTSARQCPEDQWRKTPHLCRLLDWAVSDPQSLTHFLQQKSELVNVNKDMATMQRQLRVRSNETLPIVLAHGMGDSCFNSGMQHVTKIVGQWLTTESVCVPTGDSLADDTQNGYLMSMDDNVDIWAQKIKENPILSKGFYAMGFSQGSNVIRGYIAKYNDPPVHTFLSVNGVNAGIGAVPYCRPSEANNLESGWCDFLMEQASAHAYSDFVQKHSFQANYWRDPRPEGFPLYQKHGQLAKWNNEAGFVNATLQENWAKTARFVWVLATQDGMIWPREGEHWGQPDPANPFHSILDYKESTWYKEDLFGLRSAEEAGKNVFESFEGDHLQFSMDDLQRWVTTYFQDKF